MAKASGLILACAAVLTACGGGGGGGGSSGSGGTLHVTFSYPSTHVPLYHQVNLQPQTTGFEGRTPHCTLVQGSLPGGLQMQSDCSITGRVTQAIGTVFTVKVGASGVSNTIDVTSGVTVVAPGLMYPYRSPLQPVAIGVFLDDTPTVPGWTAPPGLVASWSYRLHSGSLPTGATLDPHSGRISGNTQARGAFTADIVGTLTSQYGVFETMQNTYAVNVNVPAIGYPGSASLGYPLVAYLSQSFSATPEPQGVSLPGSSFSSASFVPSLPAGLASNGAGEISGMASGAEVASQSYDIQATLHNGGVSEATQGRVYLAVRAPVKYGYGTNGFVYVQNLQPLNVSPTETAVSPIPLQAGATRLFTQRPGQCTLPPGTALDPATGALVGTPTSVGWFSCQVDVDTTNNGVTWTFPTQLILSVQ